MIKDLCKAPFPWFGGKQHAAPTVWAALGDVCHYVEPFAGSLAMLLRRPHPANRTYYSETVNDLDGFVVNFWRAIQNAPDEVAHHASWPVSEADLHARHISLLRWQMEHPLEKLMGDPAWCDPQFAGWWVWGQSLWIGSGWASGQGPWWADENGIFFRRPRPAREPGVSKQLPHLGDDGRGVAHPGTREPGVWKKLPHLGNNGRGVAHPGTREPGVGEEPEYHPMTMPELVRWFRFLSARLRHVRILNGDWSRACTDGAALPLSVRQGKSPAGVFLDPPYSGEVRSGGMYAREDLEVSAKVREWCAAKGDDPRYRIVLAGFSGEGHEALVSQGWREVEWYVHGFLRGGMGNTGKAGTNNRRERLWLSPHCLDGKESENRTPADL